MNMKAAVLILVALLSGCASASKSFYADWIAIANPQQLCVGAESCVKHSQYRGKPLCTLVTTDKEIDVSQIGALMNQCGR